MSRKRAKYSRSRVWWGTFVALVIAAVVAYGVTDVLDATKSGARSLMADGKDARATPKAAPLVVKVQGLSSLSGAVVPGTASDVATPERPPRPQEEMPKDGVWTDRASALTLKVFGRISAPIVVRGIKAVDVVCEKPSESYTWLETEGGGAFINYPSRLALPSSTGSASARAKEVLYNGEKWAFPRQVSQSEGEGYELEVDAPAGKICTFRLAILYEAGDKDGTTLHVDADGEPFAIADPSVAADSIFYGS